MALITVEEVISRYLFNEKDRPGNINSDKYISPVGGSPERYIEIDAIAHMSGPGRFAAGTSNILREFFTSNSESLRPTGERMEFSIADIQAITGTKRDHVYQQYNYDDGASDFAERVLIFNSSSFRVSGKFVVTADGSRLVENFRIIPLDDNYDYKSDDFLAWATAGYVKDATDPSGIGSRLELSTQATRNDIPVRTYTKDDFITDYGKAEVSYVTMDPFRIKSLVDPILDRLASKSGPSHFMVDDNPIIYGTHGDDSSLNIDTLNSYQEPYEKNGCIVRAGSGNDVGVVGGIGNDTIYGGDGSDDLNGGKKDDVLRGGSDEGNDTLSGGSGNDTLLGGMGTDRLLGGSDNDRSIGGDGKDIIYGQAGNDILIGGDALGAFEKDDNARDFLAGGEGMDTYMVSQIGQFAFDWASPVDYALWANADILEDHWLIDDVLLKESNGQGIDYNNLLEDYWYVGPDPVQNGSWIRLVNGNENEAPYSANLYLIEREGDAYLCQINDQKLCPVAVLKDFSLDNIKTHDEFFG